MKRSADDPPPQTVDEARVGGCTRQVCAFFRDTIPEDVCPAEYREAAIKKIQEEDIDGDVLRGMSESDLKDVLDITKFGPRRKVARFIKDVYNVSQDAENVKPPQTLFTTSERPTSVLAPGGTASASSSIPGTAPFLQTPTPTPVARPEPLSTTPCPMNKAKIMDVVVTMEPVVAEAKPVVPQTAQAPSAAATEEDDLAAAANSYTQFEEEDSARMEDQLNAEASCAGECEWVVKRLKGLLSSSQYNAWASPECKAARLEELSLLEKRIGLPGMSVVVVGNTGAGKSTMLNAVLGETNVLPTNGMRACTAALVELSYATNVDAPPYEAAVEFVSEAEWARELDILMDDLTQQDGRAILHVTNPESHNYVSWCKVVAVYGETYTHSSEKTNEIGPDGRYAYRPMMVERLKAKLRNDRVITRFLGKTEKLTADDPRTFRRKVEKYVDSTGAVDSATRSFWPVVRMVRMRSAKWTVLKSGARLVDAPGVRDDNSARDGIVKGFLKEADSIWIVSHISRAVNDKTAKDMLGETFRRQLLMDGLYGSIVFVATQSDSLLRSEIARNLGLDDDASSAVCASARNQFSKERIRDDFVEGILEMQRMAGDTAVSEAELRAKFDLPVLTISAVDFQKLTGARTSDGPPNVWGNVEETEIPALRRLVHSATLQRRRAKMRTQVDSVVQFCDSMQTFLNDQGTNDQLLRQKMREVFTAELQERFTVPLTALVTKFDGTVAAQFKTAIGPQLEVGAEAATGEVMTTVQQWGDTLHWATYKAHCRRHGTWRRDFNEEMAEPVYRSVSTFWERTFVGELGRSFEELKGAAQGCITAFNDRMAARLQELSAEARARLEGMRDSQQRALLTKIGSYLEKAKVEAHSRQRNVNREITPHIKEHMVPCYEEATAERGTGSAKRRRTLVEGFVDKSRGKMFRDAIAPVTTGLDSLRAEIVALMKKAFQVAGTDITISYSMFWEDPTADARNARNALAAEIAQKGVFHGAHFARRRLLEAMGEKLETPDVDDDDIQDMTATEGERVKAPVAG